MFYGTHTVFITYLYWLCYHYCYCCHSMIFMSDAPLKDNIGCFVKLISRIEELGLCKQTAWVQTQTPPRTAL